MSSGNVSSTSTYSPGKGVSFARDIASRVVDAATAAKDEKKLQQKIIADGGTVPEKDQQGLFVKALKQQFITNPVNDIKKSWNKKAAKAGKVAGMFGGKGEKLQSKLTGGGSGLFKVKQGFDRSGYKKAKKEDDSNDNGGGGGRPSIISGLGELVLDIQQIANSVSSIQGLISTQMNLSLKMSDSISEIKNVLAEQLDIQQKQADNEERAQREASLEASANKSASGNVESTSTMGGGGDLISNLFNVVMQIGELLETLGVGAEALAALGTAGLAGGAVVGTMALSSAAGKATRSWGDQLRGKNTKEKADFLSNPLVMAGGTMLGPAASLLVPGITSSLMMKNNLVFGSVMKKMAEDQINGSIDVIARFLDLESAEASTIGAPLKAIWEFIVSGGDLSKSNAVMADEDAQIRESFRKVFQGGGGTKGSWGTLGLYGRQGKLAGGGVMIGEAGPEAVMSLHGAEGKKMLGGGMNSDSMSDVQDTYYSALAGSTLAITKDFVEGLGPLGASVAPTIQDDVSKLGRVFDIPSTSTTVSVGGQSLRADPQAGKKGEAYLKELITGTVKKLKDNKNENNTSSSSTGSSTGGDTGGDTGTNAPSPTGGSNPPQVSATDFGKTQLQNTKVETTNAPGKGGETTTVTNKNLQKVTGQNPGKYYYDGYGNVYAVDKDEKRILSKQELKNGVPGTLGGVFGNLQFYRNLNNGVVSISSPGDAQEQGWYDYASNSVREVVKGNGTKGNSDRIDWVYVNNSTKYKSGFTESTPYGKSTISAAAGAHVVTSMPFQNRNIPGVTSGMHMGADVGANYEPLKAYVDGEVISTSPPDSAAGYGPKFVVWRGSDGKGHMFAHLSQLFVKKGDKLRKGQKIGVSGSAGSGPHLHWEVASNPADVGQDKSSKRSRVNPIALFGSEAPFGGDIRPGEGSTDISPSGEGEPGSSQAQVAENPIEAIQKAFQGILANASLMGRTDITTKEQFSAAQQAAQSSFSNMFSGAAPPSSSPNSQISVLPGRTPVPASGAVLPKSQSTIINMPGTGSSINPASVGSSTMQESSLASPTRPIGSTGTMLSPIP